MASQALVVAATTALQPFKPTAYQEHASIFQQQQQQPSPSQQQSPQVLAPTKSKNQQSSPGGSLRKGLDNITKCLERKIDQQILQAQARAYNDTSSPPGATANGVNHKKVHWEEHSHDAQAKA